MKFVFPLLFIALAFFSPAPVSATDNGAIHQQPHLDALSVYKKNADDYVAKNLNRFGLNQLLNYDTAIDTMYKTEMNDTIAAFKSSYNQSHIARSNAIANLNRQITELTEKKENATTGFTGLLRKAGIASMIWLAIVLVLIQIRSKALKRVQARLGLSKGQLSASNSKLDEGAALIRTGHEHAEVNEQLNAKTLEIQKLFTETQLTPENGFPKEAADKLKASIAELVRSATAGHKITSTILSQDAEPGIEKVSTNLNQLCDQCFELVYSGMISPDPDLKITVSKDLEKNLPQIKLIPEAVAQLLINVLINAFQSVQERQEKKVKGYAPKVTISTRVLPRFLQVRIHDNGEGMTDDIIQQVGIPYFTMKTTTNSSGLGMHFAKKIVGEMHLGELKIESEPGNKTDVYIKFFTS
ncbi:MAG: sensor histidine kinase [Bacteroidetes bacterium]|nr:sensor histidine kinase [Bacteroidota bacterium]